MTKLRSQKLHLPKKWLKMGSIIGHRIDYNGVGALRGQWHKAKINPLTPSHPPPPPPPQEQQLHCIQWILHWLPWYVSRGKSQFSHCIVSSCLVSWCDTASSTRPSFHAPAVISSQLWCTDLLSLYALFPISNHMAVPQGSVSFLKILSYTHASMCMCMRKLIKR